MESVVQEWVSKLSWKQQTVLLCAIRGHDGVARDDPSKFITRSIRGCVLKNATNRDSKTPQHTDFMRMDFQKLEVPFESVIQDIDKYNVHWLMHVTHAAEILGYKHPDPTISAFWKDFYLSLVDALHLYPEPEVACNARLRDGVPSPKKRFENHFRTQQEFYNPNLGVPYEKDNNKLKRMKERRKYLLDLFADDVQLNANYNKSEKETLKKEYDALTKEIEHYENLS